jgi:hypothetical protein
MRAETTGAMIAVIRRDHSLKLTNQFHEYSSMLLSRSVIAQMFVLGPIADLTNSFPCSPVGLNN